jgi:hypothetical protein
LSFIEANGMNPQNARFRLHAVEQRFPKTILIETQQRQSVSNTTHLGKDNIPNIGLAFLVVAFIVAAILLLFKHARFGKVLGERTLTPEAFHKIPCRSCRYFSHNPYLNCAIHPSLVLTGQAIDCPDYCAKGESTETKHDVPCS